MLTQTITLIILAVLSLSTHAGNVIIKKNINEEVAYDKDSFESTDHTASVSAITWTKAYSACRFDCLFSRFDGSITDLKIDGIMRYEGNIDVIESSITLQKFGKIIVYAAGDIIVLQLTRDQVKLLESQWAVWSKKN